MLAGEFFLFYIYINNNNNNHNKNPHVDPSKKIKNKIKSPLLDITSKNTHLAQSSLVPNHGYVSVVRPGSIVFLSTYIPEKMTELSNCRNIILNSLLFLLFY